MVFWGDQRSVFKKSKLNFPENTLCYVNQSHACTIKSGEIAADVQNFILVRLIVARNGPEKIDSYECKRMK